MIDARYRLEVATPHDAAAVTGLLEICYAELLAVAYEPSILDVALPVMTKANPALLPSGTYYTVRGDDPSIVGCGGWTFERPGTTRVEAGVAHLRHFAVHPRRIGEGIGRLVFERCEREARAAAVGALEVYSTLNGQPFYASLGFAKLDDITVPLGPDVGLPSVWMRRMI